MHFELPPLRSSPLDPDQRTLPVQSKIIHNGQTLEPTVPGMGETFRKAGYQTDYVGKWHLYHEEGQFVPEGPYRFGFEDWHAWANTNKHYDGTTFNPETGEPITMPGYQPTRMTDHAIDFLQKQKGAEKPWCLVVSWNPPHPPYNPPAEEMDLYDEGALKLRPNVRLATPADKLVNPYPATRFHGNTPAGTSGLLRRHHRDRQGVCTPFEDAGRQRHG